MKLTAPASPKEEDFEALKVGLNKYNESFTGILLREKVSSFVKDDLDNVLGRVLAEIKWGWFYVEGLWVDESVRSGGWESKLLLSMEDYAISRDVRNFRLETTSFQALTFYEKLGYTIFGHLPDMPPGHTSYFLKNQKDI